MKKTIHIEGMTCNHCKATVEKALSELAEVEEVKVDLEEKKAEVSLKEEISDDILKTTIEEKGYEVVSID